MWFNVEIYIRQKIFKQTIHSLQFLKNKKIIPQTTDLFKAFW